MTKRIDDILAQIVAAGHEPARIQLGVTEWCELRDAMRLDPLFIASELYGTRAQYSGVPIHLAGGGIAVDALRYDAQEN